MTGWHFCIRIGRWMLNKDGLFRWTDVTSVNGKGHWQEWTKIL